MPQIITTLIALIMSLVIGTGTPGNPEITPPVGQGEEKGIGNQVSQEAKHMNFENKGQNPEGEQNREQEENQNGPITQTQPDTTKVPAFNNKAEKEMPTLIPQVAVDKSPALEESEGDEQNGDEPIEDTSEPVHYQNSFQFGFSLANSQPDDAKENGNAFGENTARNASGNGQK